MPVPAGGDRGRNHNAGGIRSLPYILKMNTASYLLDHDRRKTLRPELLMDTQEVDLRHSDDIIANTDPRRHAGDESD